MKHSPTYIKWFSRGFLISLVVIMTYIVTRPSYNFSHWMPHGLLRSVHIPYKAILFFEQHADKALHFFGAAILVWLIVRAQLFSINKGLAFTFTVLLCVGAEVVQWKIGRGYNSSDLLLGISGSFMAYLGITENKHRPA